VEKEDVRAPKSKAQMIKQALSPSQQFSKRPKREPLTPAKRKERISDQVVSVNLFGSQPLNIFAKANDKPDICATWANLQARELKLAITHPPRNYFEKMALWTEQGKVWKFPIDNEQGWEEEHQTDFTEHVMLEMHLEDWCPSKGPVRHFMELVCVGLSKNNFLSAREKYDHIMWYKGYFEEKRETLGDLMTLGIGEGSSDEQKQIDP
jgi:small subunit ribosomal protein S31